MKIGFCFPYTQPDMKRETMLAWYRRVEDAGFSSLSCGERVIGSSVDMGITLAGAAAVTERIRIVPTLYVLPMHPAVWVAKHAATLDVLSGGRVTITVGVGGRDHDYRCMERERIKPQQKMEQQVGLIRRIWKGEPPFEGTEPIGPTPVQPGGPPILAGVMGPKATQRAARWADGVYSWSGNGAKQEIAGQLANVRSAWDAAGRDQKPQHTAGFWFSLAPDADARLKAYVYKYLKIIGDGPAKAISSMVDRSTPDRVRASLDAYEELGVEECMLNSATAELAEIDAILEVLEKR